MDKVIEEGLEEVIRYRKRYKGQKGTSRIKGTLFQCSDMWPLCDNLLISALIFGQQVTVGFVSDDCEEDNFAHWHIVSI